MNIQFNNVVVELSFQVTDTIQQYIQYPGKKEAGGILLGKYIPLEKRYIITEATRPSFCDKRGFASFVRKKKPAQKIINRRWKESNGEINYLGEWHTHGCDLPIPSDVDKELIQSLYRDGSNVWPNIIMIILGRSACCVAIGSNFDSDDILEIKYIEGEDYAFIFH